MTSHALKLGKKESKFKKIKRTLLKLSGQAFSGNNNSGISEDHLFSIADQFVDAHSRGVELAIVPGAGNIIRGRDITYLDRIIADHMGMLATIINGLALKEALRQRGLVAQILSAIKVGFLKTSEPKEAIDYLKEGQVVIFVGGTGNPYFTTDTAASLRASEIDADIILKATNVDGVYSKDPQKSEDAELIKKITYREVIRSNLSIIDLPALDICRRNKIPILVFNFFEKNNLSKILTGELIGSLISN